MKRREFIAVTTAMPVSPRRSWAQEILAGSAILMPPILMRGTMPGLQFKDTPKDDGLGDPPRWGRFFGCYSFVACR